MGNEQKIEFYCREENCPGIIRFALNELGSLPPLKCPRCGTSHRLPEPVIEKLNLLADLIAAIKKAEPVLGDASVAVETENGRVLIPYFLLLTRMSTELALKIGDGDYHFYFVCEPLKTGESEE